MCASAIRAESSEQRTRPSGPSATIFWSPAPPAVWAGTPSPPPVSWNRGWPAAAATAYDKVRETHSQSEPNPAKKNEASKFLESMNMVMPSPKKMVWFN